MNNKIVLGFLGLLIVAGLAWVFIESSKPLPGIQFPDEGRDHIKITDQVDYKTNPPTSGKHLPEWIPAGVYDLPKDDRNLVHSLEHGYVIMSYNCSVKTGFIPSAFAQVASDSASQATSSANLPPEFSSEDCKKLASQLSGINDKKGKKKLIIIPRPKMEAKIVLTSWRWMEKLDSFDEQKIIAFIDAHQDHGPEQTME